MDKEDEMPENGKTIRPGRWSIALSIGTVTTIVIGTVYFMIFIYQMRDAIKENILANNVNQVQVLAKSDEQIRVGKQIACLLKFHIYQDKAIYKGQCDSGFFYPQ